MRAQHNEWISERDQLWVTNDSQGCSGITHYVKLYT
jgi:hypothetical protein